MVENSFWGSFKSGFSDFADEFGDILQKAGFGEGVSRVGSFVGLLSGWIGKVAAKAGETGINAISKAVFGKKIEQMSAKEVMEIQKAFIEAKVPDVLKQQVEKMLLDGHVLSEDDEMSLMP